MSNIQFRISKNTETDKSSLVAFIDGQLTDPIDDSHPNYHAITEALKGQVDGTSDITGEALLDLFDVAKAVERNFEQLGERVSVRGNQILFDGDAVGGPLEDQILDFLNEGKNFAPLVKFYEKLATNPLGNVREGLFNWIKGQKAEGNFTINDDGDIIGYKSTVKSTPQWRKGVSTVYVPSQPSRQADVVGGLEVPKGKFIEQIPGDVVEMPRSKVLNAPSQACGDGLHIGTWSYAKDFYGGSTVLLVKFSPRDIVSLPDNNSSWKLRVSRYTVIKVVTAPLTSILYTDDTVKPEVPSNPFKVGQRVTPATESDKSIGVVTEIVSADEVRVDYISNGRDAKNALHEAVADIKPAEDAKPDVSLSIDKDYESLDVDGPFKNGDILIDDSGDEHVIFRDQSCSDVDDEWETTEDYVAADSIVSAKRKKTVVTSKGRPGSKRDSRGRFV